MIFSMHNCIHAGTPTTKLISQLGACSIIESILSCQSFVLAIFFGLIKWCEPEWRLLGGNAT